MTQPPANILLRIEQLLNAGKLQEARVLLVDFIQLNPNSARAWWLLSMTLVDADRQAACLKRVLRLDPENKLAQTRLARLNTQVTPPAEISPFTSSIMGETEEIVDDISIIPDWAKPASPRAVSQPLPPSTPEAESTIVALKPNPPEEPSVAPPEHIEPVETQVEPPESAWQPETPAISPVPAQPESVSISAGQPGSETSPVVQLPSDYPAEAVITPPMPVEPEVPSIPATPQIGLLTFSPLSSDATVQEATLEVPASPEESELSPVMAAGQVEPESVSIEPVPSIQPEVEILPQPVTGEAELTPSLPPELVEPGMVSGVPDAASAQEPELIEPVSSFEREDHSASASSSVEPQAISPDPGLVSSPVESVEEAPEAVEQAVISTKPAVDSEPDEPFTTLPIPGAVAAVSPVSSAVIVEKPPAGAPPSAEGTSEASSKPPPYVEPNTASTKRALFSELDKSFNKPPVPFEPAVTPSLSPQSVQTRAPSIKPVSSKAVAAPPKPPAPIKPSTAGSRPGYRGSGWEIAVILIIGVVILAAVAVIGYIAIQHRGQSPDPALVPTQNPQQQTLAVAQTLTNLPLPTLIPTWTLSPTWTGEPTATFTSSPTPSPTPEPTATKTPRPPNQVGPTAGLYAPDFSLTDQASGKQVTLSQYDGQPLLIFFWATWCIHCDNEMSVIESIFQANKAAGLVVLTVNAAEDPVTVAQYRQDNSLTFPILLDPGSVFKIAYNVNLDSIPLHYFINSSGMIKTVRMGELTQAEIQTQVDAILPQHPTATP